MQFKTWTIPWMPWGPFLIYYWCMWFYWQCSLKSHLTSYWVSTTKSAIFTTVGVFKLSIIFLSCVLRNLATLLCCFIRTAFEQLIFLISICFTFVPFDRSFPNCVVPLFQSDASCKTFPMKMSFICMWMETHFQMKGYAPRLALKKRYKTTRKWSIQIYHWISSQKYFDCQHRKQIFHARED